MTGDTLRVVRETIFTTFYSFKGGVGRTMALASTACILAGRGRRVLMIDFDLEAPGLTYLALEHYAPQQRPVLNGLVEIIQEVIDSPEVSLLWDLEKQSQFRQRYTLPLSVPQSLQVLPGGYLDILPCGTLDAEYSRRLHALDFKRLYSEGLGQPLFQLLKTRIKQLELYDYILIDSRTGFSDEGGICTRDLADHIVVVMGLNHQNVDGTVQFLQRLSASEWQGGAVVFVASPVPSAQETLRDQRIKEAQEAIEAAGYATDFDIRIPYHPRLALEEEPFRTDWTGTDLFPAYQQIHNVLRELANDSLQAALNRAWNAIENRQFETALNFLKDVQNDAPDAVLAFLSLFTGRYMDNDPSLRPHAEPFYQLWLDIEGNDARKRIGIRLQLGLHFIKMGEYDRARAQITGIRDMALPRLNSQDTGYIRHLYGLLLSLRGHYAQALEEYESARQVFLRFGNLESMLMARQAVARIYGDQGRHQEALDLYRQNLEAWKEVGAETHVIASTLIGIGWELAALGALEEGFNTTLNAITNLEAANTIDAIQPLAVGYINAADIMRRQGKSEQAQKYLRQYWKHIQTYGNADVRYEAYIVRARIKQALGNVKGAMKDAQTATKFYREQGVQTILAKEAEEIVALLKSNSSQH